MTTWKQALSVLAAFALGALVVYAILAPRHPEEWGVVVVHFGSGPNLWGLYESKADCLYARPAYMKKFGKMMGGIAGQTDRVLVPADDDQLPVTFSCLPLSEIRGLHLDVGARPPNPN